MNQSVHLSASNDAAVALAVLAIAVIAFLSLTWQSGRSRSIAEQWAEENGFTLMSSESRWLRRGSFFWTTSRGQTVYYITVRNAEGRQRSGYLRCGSFWDGLLSHKAAVPRDTERE